MAADPDQLTQIVDFFAGLDRTSTGRLFSGTAHYVDSDVMFAAVLGDTVWMKSDTST